ncbi:MAG: LytTR family DNA-binding domain-containing protein [Saprospiraceae bacterium]|nr:LytTR family DNA-binding domain-containing protein [Saprospiraceae bacterium]MDW8483482.1 LytTR family DNA-binding domain-containing protein [Saprospiraceae bacterium]
MTPLRCIIVEDEPLAAEILAEYIQMTPFLQLVDVCPDALKALEVVREKPVDVIFLDINLPKLTGLDFVKALPNQPKVIITSAYHEFAVEGFDLQVVDYLLKPIEFNRFTKAVNKILHTHRIQEIAHNYRKSLSQRPFYFFAVQKRAVKIYLDEILFIESLKDTVIIHTPDHSYPTHYHLNELEEMLPREHFLRIHRSFLVAIDKIDSFSAAEIEIGGRTLPIGRKYKEYVAERLES